MHHFIFSKSGKLIIADLDIERIEKTVFDFKLIIFDSQIKIYSKRLII